MTTDAALSERIPQQDDRLADVAVPIAWTIAPVTDLAKMDALAQAAEKRALKQAADTFASTGRNLFVHYATPILSKRRDLFLASGATRKRYPKTAAQVWLTLDSDEVFSWTETARELRLCMKQRILAARQCLVDAGRLSDRSSYISHAEVAVAAYLNTPVPPTIALQLTDESCDSKNDSKYNDDDAVASTKDVKSILVPDMQGMTFSQGDEESQILPIATDANVTILHTYESNDTTSTENSSSTELLDTLPDHFEYEQNMLYSHFAKYDYNEVRKAEGKHQIAMLRQLADRFDKTGKTLFYYYTVPRLCKQEHPPTKGETVTGKAAELWRFLPVREKGKWTDASARLKKQLGDGDILGLETLQLDSLEPQVLQLHELAEAAVSGFKV